MTIPPGELAPGPQKSHGTIIGIIAAGVCVLCIIPVAIVLPLLARFRATVRQQRDATQVRGMHNGMAIWAMNNNDAYPIPSQIDAKHSTIAAGQPKDLPRHVVSVLIFEGFFSADICVSPAEINPLISIHESFDYSRPQAAANPAKARWDPAFAATPHDTDTNSLAIGRGGLSYAILPFVGERRKLWTSTSAATTAIIGNRGPAYDADGDGPHFRWKLHKDTGGSQGGNVEVGVSSNTLRIHGGRTTWEGNVVYNDNHVNFETSPAPATALFPFAGFRSPLPDNLFVDENDTTRAKDSTTGLSGPALGNTNNLLRVWTGGTFGSKGELIDIPSNFWFD